MTVSPNHLIAVEHVDSITEVPVSVLHHLGESADMLARVTSREVIDTVPGVYGTTYIDPLAQVAKISRSLSERPFDAAPPTVQAGEVGFFGQESDRE